MPQLSLRNAHPIATAINIILEAHKAADLILVQEETPSSSLTATEDSASPFRKHFVRFPSIELPSSQRHQTLTEVLQQRKSIRKFDADSRMNIESLGQILNLAVRPRRDEKGSLSRPYPSAGARYPVEVYLAACRFNDLPSGLYYYDAYDHLLKVLLDRDIRDDIFTAIGDDRISEPCLIVIITAALYRSCLRYGGRGYRYALLEAGAVAQTIDLCCRGNGLGVVWIGGFADDLIHEILDINWEMEIEAPLLLLAIGAENDATN